MTDETNRTPRPAATLVLLRETAEDLEAFMVVRHHEIDFAGGALVFPGGKVDADDQRVAEIGAGDTADALNELDTIGRIAAIRETYEEAGVLFARDARSGAVLDPRQFSLADERQRLAAGDLKFSEFLHVQGLRLDTDALTPFARWIGPKHMPKRFDTMFYLATAPADQAGSHDGSESIDSVWISPRQACREADAGERTIIFPTRRNLERLGQYQRIDTALAAARAQPVVQVEPFVEDRDGERYLCIRNDAGYPVTSELLSKALRGA